MRLASAAVALIVLVAGCSGGTAPTVRPDVTTTGTASSAGSSSPTAEATVSTPAFPAEVTNRSAVRYVERLQFARSHDDAVAEGAYRVEGGCDGWLVGARDGTRYVYVDCSIATYSRDGSHGDGLVRAVYLVDSEGATRVGDGPHRRVDAVEHDRPTTVTLFSASRDDASVVLAWLTDDGVLVRRVNATAPGDGTLFVTGLSTPRDVSAHRLVVTADGAGTALRVPATERHVVVVLPKDGAPVVGFDR